MALPYRLAALWGGQAGSLLLWLFILSVYASACVRSSGAQNRTLMPWVAVVLLANAIFFLVLLCFVTDPFERLPPAAVLSDGAGLNPLLQHPVMMIHPVMLYTGLVGLRRCRSRSRSRRWSTGELGPPGSGRRGAGRSSRGSSSPSASCSAGAGPTKCSAGAATGAGIRSRTPRSCPGCPRPRTCTR